MRWMLWLIVMLVMAGCAGASSQQQTLEAVATTQSANLAEIGATATAQSERLQITLEGVETQIARIQSQRVFMISTLEARGIAVDNLQGITLEPLTATPTPFGLVANDTPTPTENLNVPDTLISPTPPPSGFSSPLGLGNIVTSTSVGADDCALDVANQFTPDTPEIYLVATATGFTDNTTVTTSWTREGTVLTDFSYTYDAIDRACIWFFADQTDFEFLPGSYTITVGVNGTIAGQVNFVINPGDAISDG
ncbi:MAG: hypothetical protein RLP44_28680 [Aggregatilineales bacterium]